MFYFSLHGRGLAPGDEAKSISGCFLKKIGANEGNLCVLSGCCGKREADTEAKAFDLLIWPLENPGGAEAEEQRRRPSFSELGCSHLSWKLAEHLPAGRRPRGRPQKPPEGIIYLICWETVQRRRKSVLLYSACWKRWRKMDGPAVTSARSSHEPRCIKASSEHQLVGEDGKLLLTPAQAAIHANKRKVCREYG